MAKPRKWSNFKGTIPEEEVELTPREQAIRKEADRLRGIGFEEDGSTRAKKSMKDMAAEYQGLVEEEEFEALAAKARSIKYEALERVMLDELKSVEEIAGTDTWRGEGQSFSPKLAVIPVVHDRQALNKFLADNNLDDLRTLEFPKLRSLVTDILESFGTMTPEERAALTVTPADPIPGVKVFLKPGISRRTI